MIAIPERRGRNGSETQETVDLTVPLRHGMDAYPGEPTAEFDRFTTLASDGVEMWNVRIFSQLGTHVDAPAHFVDGGRTIDGTDLNTCIGAAVVVDAHPASGEPGGELSLAPFADAESSIRGTGRVLIRTGWSKRYGKPDFWTEFPQVSFGLAERLVEWGVRFIGLDTPSPHREQQGAVHEALLRPGVVLAECLTNLEALVQQEVYLICLPLPLVGLDGSPARIVALQNGATP